MEVADKTLQILEKKFGSTTNELGYKTLDPHVRMIYSDSMSYNNIKDILDRVTVRHKYSTDNIVFGIGGNLIQNVNRDIYKFAFKASAGLINGEWRDVHKQPVTSVMKTSRAGRMKLIIDDATGNLKTVPLDVDGADVMKVVFENGKIKKKYTFDEIRKRAGWNEYYGS
jgi:nicotinamide phosphoribosyltransferase